MLVVGRHPQCDTRLDSIRISRRHCCMSPDGDGVVVRDLGSTNGIRINGRRVEMGRLRAGDELSIAHIRYRLEDGIGHEATLAGPPSSGAASSGTTQGQTPTPTPTPTPAENPLAAAVRELLPSAMADRCRIQVIVQMEPDSEGEMQGASCRPDSSP